MESINESKQQPVVVQQASTRDRNGTLIAVFAILALLVIGEIYSLSRISGLGSAMRSQLTAEQAQANKQLSAEIANKVQSLQDANAQSLDELRTELDSTATKMSTNEKKALLNANYAGYLVRKLKREDAHNTAQLEQSLASKADQQQVGTLTQDVSNTKSDLAQTKQTVGTLASDLGMARSHLGTLIATDHQDIVALQKLGQRDYYEFTLLRNKRKTVAGVGLQLKHSNIGNHTFNVDMFYNDMKVTRKNLAIDQPVFFMPKYMHTFYELVVYQVAHNKVVGYISTPKGAASQEMASRTQ